jgi:glyoxylase-like metal-dependent hydrolase (beta-lactamase superfamily II)
MRVHHLSCLTLCPLGAKLIDGQGSFFSRGRMECHCLLIETDAHGLVLVDTGIGTEDCADPAARLGGAFTRILIGTTRPSPAQTALHQVKALGLSPEDVRHIVLTHLDLDHAGGLPDFPRATVHVLAAEQDAALARRTYPERNRYRPAHFAHGPRWATYRPEGERWRGFECVRALEGLPPELLLVPLTGHTRGHACVAVEGAPGGPLLHCGDAYFHRAAIEPALGPIPAGLRLFETQLAFDRTRIPENHARLRALRESAGDLRVFCAHDPRELDALVLAARTATRDAA